MGEKVCQEPGCNRVATHGTELCPKHQRVAAEQNLLDFAAYCREKGQPVGRLIMLTPDHCFLKIDPQLLEEVTRSKTLQLK